MRIEQQKSISAATVILFHLGIFSGLNSAPVPSDAAAVFVAVDVVVVVAAAVLFLFLSRKFLKHFVLWHLFGSCQ